MKNRNIVTLLVALMMVLAACSSSDSDDGATTTAAPTTTVAPTVAAPTNEDAILDPAVAVVVSALEAKNNGDLAGWLSFYEGGKNPRTPLHAEQILMNANQRWEVVEPCGVKEVDAEGNTTVECVIHDANDFWGVGGIGDTVPGTFIVNEDLLITFRENIFGSSRRNSFNSAFHQWLKETYPGVFSESGFKRVSSNGPGFDSGNPDLMIVAVEYVEEFVAQSDTYPLDPSDQ